MARALGPGSPPGPGLSRRRSLSPRAGLLWNLSSTDELKEELIADALPVLADRVIIPFSGWCDGNSNVSREVVDPEVFFNATGCLR